MAKLPYDAEVEYLESTGTQLIDTGVKASRGFGFSLDFMMLERGGVSDNTAFFCGYGGVWNAGISLCDDKSSPTGIRVVYGANGVASSGQYAVNVRYRAVVSADPYTFSLSGGTPFSASFTPGSSYAGDYSFTVFHGPYSLEFTVLNPKRMRCYAFSLTDAEGVLVRDMIPVRFTNELGIPEGAMYDKVTGRLFRNSGTGFFVVGPDTVVVEKKRGKLSLGQIEVPELPSKGGVWLGKKSVKQIWLGKNLVWQRLPDAKDYVQDGLVAMWDVKFSPPTGQAWDATVGEDLAFSLHGTSVDRDGGLQFAGSSSSYGELSQAQSAVFPSSTGTLEIVLKLLSIPSANGRHGGVVMKTPTSSRFGLGLFNPNIAYITGANNTIGSQVQYGSNAWTSYVDDFIAVSVLYGGSI